MCNLSILKVSIIHFFPCHIVTLTFNLTRLFTFYDKFETPVNETLTLRKFLFQQCSTDVPVLGHKAFTAIPSVFNSSAIPNTHIDIPYLAMV